MKTESGKDNMFTLVGKGVSQGLAKGKAFVHRDVLQRDSELYVIDRAQIDVIPRFLRTGIRSLSVVAALVPDVKNAIRNSSS